MISPYQSFFRAISRKQIRNVAIKLGPKLGLNFSQAASGSLLCKQHSTASGNTPRVCIVGSGPAGFYTAQQLLKSDKTVIVDIYEKLPVPFGLVRYGVAPDHPDVKNVINTFEIVAQNERCNFYGNVNIGTDVTTRDLREIYDAVVLAYGADNDKTLGIKGEKLDGVLSARAFVGWYNGMPAQSELHPDLSTDTAIVIGHGNVAVDVARILLSPYDILKHTDICSYALEALKNSQIRKVVVAGRRGPLEAAFTIKEIRELIKLPECKTIFKQADLQHVKEEISNLPRQKKRIVELMCKTAFDEPTSEDSVKRNALYPTFFRSPVEILEKNSKVSGVLFEINKLVTSEDGSQKALGTGEYEEIKCGLVLRSIGYKSVRVDEGIPFDSKMGVIPNKDGRVIECAGSDDIVEGLYCSGWIKHGPVGVILTTMTEAKATGSVIAQDIKDAKLSLKGAETHDINKFLESKGVDAVTYVDWERIDQEETRRGIEKKKPREKIVSKEEMLDVVIKSRHESE